MKTSLIATALIGMTIAAVYVYPSIGANVVGVSKTPPSVTPEPRVVESAITPIEDPQAVSAAQAQGKKIEVVFVLDTTGSMSGLIQGAKDNIWSIASSMASAESAPTIKMGLVAYRDKGDDYVTKTVDLSEDLDTNYGTLMGFQANGGGDHPEDVNKGLYEAVSNMSWSQDKDTYRVIFLVGDAPPQSGYQGEMKYPEIVEMAHSKGIVINTIQCGNNADTLTSWKHIAQLSQGDFFQVEQSGSAVALSTPFDKQIASLSRELDGTRLFYGDKAEMEKKRVKVEATSIFNSSASDISIARKAEFNSTASGMLNFADDSELVDAFSSGRVELDDISVEELPVELQSLDESERQTVLTQKASKRKELQDQIASLSRQRSEYLAKEIEQSSEVDESIDYKIYQSVKAQAAEKGLVYSSEAPKY